MMNWYDNLAAISHIDVGHEFIIRAHMDYLTRSRDIGLLGIDLVAQTRSW